MDLATYFQQGQQLSEHMFITGLTGPDGRKTYFAGAAPSGCGKTTTAMVGTDFIGDDLAQMWIAADGTLRAVNPEKGIFGIVADVNREGDPYLMKCLREPGTEVIFSNVLVDADKVPHWVGNGEKAPKKGVNFQGDWFEGKTDDDGRPVPISHPNARATLANDAIENYNETVAEDANGAHIKVITYSGRDSDTMPPIWVAESPDHGVVIGASIVSAATATEVGASGVKRQPWANAPFIPGALADYMHAQFELFNSEKLRDKPVMAGLNYFPDPGRPRGRGQGAAGREAGREGLVGLARETRSRRRGGHRDADRLPPEVRRPEAALWGDRQGVPAGALRQAVLSVRRQHPGPHRPPEGCIRQRNGHPPRLFEVYAEQRQALLELKEKCGSVATPDQLAGVAA